MKRTSHGMILGEDGKNVKSEETLSILQMWSTATAPHNAPGIMFMGDFGKAAPWSPNAVKAASGFSTGLEPGCKR